MKKSLKVGDVVLRREKGQQTGNILGQAVVLALKVKSDLPIHTSDYQKVRFAFVGADPTRKENRSVGDLFFADRVGRTHDKKAVAYIKQRAKDDALRTREEKAALKAKYGRIPKEVIDKIHALEFGTHESSVCELLREAYA